MGLVLAGDFYVSNLFGGLLQMLINIKEWLKTRQGQIFLKSFLATMLAVIILVTAGMMIWNRFTRPPDIPPIEWVQVPTTEPDNEDCDEEPDDNDRDEDEDERELMYVWPIPERFTAEDRRELFWTFLIIGLNEGTNANTIMVASYCGVTREANLVSIPRDVAVRETGNARKLSSSYMIGAGGGRGIAGGVTQVQLDVLRIIGFIPDFYVVLDYDAFFTIIDAVGGVDIYVPMRMLYEDPLQDLFIDIQPGWYYNMDSATALNFVRFRRTNWWTPYPGISDFQRIQNQQALIEAVIRELLRPQNLNPFRLHEFVRIFNESIHTNLTIPEATYFAFELNHIRRTEEGTDALSTDYFRPVSTSNCGRYYEFLGPANVLEIVNRTINPFLEDIESGDLRIVRE